MTNNQLFLKYAQEGEKMDALVALRLLIKAYISECGASIGMRTLIYTSAEMWSYWRLPFHPDNPLTLQQIDGEPFIHSMPILCEDYKPEQYDSFDIAPGFDDESLKQLCIEHIDHYDEETMRALCWGIHFLPIANNYFMEVEYMDDDEATKYLHEQRTKLNQSIEQNP